MDSAPKSSALGYVAAAGVVLVFVLGIVAGRFVTVYPLRRALGYWDLAASLGTMADDNRDHDVRAAAYLDPAKAREAMHSYTWVMPNSPAPFLGTLTGEGERNGVVVTKTGFRAAADPQMPKPEGRVRIVLVGGSTAFSVGAPNEGATIGGALETVLNEGRASTSTVTYEVFTFANPSWSSTHERIAVENVVRHFDPDVVIAFSGTNDAVWAQLGRDQHMFRTHWEETWFRVDEQANQLAGRGPLPDPVRVSKTPTPVAEAVAKLEQNVRISHFVLREEGARLVYALQPTLYAASRLSAREQALLAAQSEDKHAYFDDMYPKIAAGLGALDAEGFSFFDLSDVFADAEGQEVFLDAYHFGDRGNRLIAEALSKRLAQAGLTHH